MMLMDKFENEEHESAFSPERWTKPANENPFHHIPFAAGPRMCVGKPIAMELMHEMLKAFLIQYPIEFLEPEIGHLYSGRDNDGKESFKESFYQIKIFVRAIWQSFWIGLGKEKLARCPFKSQSEPDYTST